MDKERQSKRKRLGILLILLACVVSGLIIWYVGIPMVKMAKNPEQFVAYMNGMGVFGPVIFILMIILQVIVAIIPGGVFEIASGYAFGVLGGTIICDIGTTIGSLIAFLLARKFGLEFVELFFPKDKIESVRFLKTNERSDLILFLFFLIPGTPKDLLSYLVGCTDLSISRWILITSIGRLPAILLSTMSGSALSTSQYGRFVAVIGLMVVLSIAGVVFYTRNNREKNAKPKG